MSYICYLSGKGKNIVVVGQNGQKNEKNKG